MENIYKSKLKKIINKSHKKLTRVIDIAYWSGVVLGVYFIFAYHTCFGAKIEKDKPEKSNE